MTIEQKIMEGIRRACSRAGSQLKLARSSGLSQGQLSDYLCGRRKIDNMAVATLKKLFPELSIQFWPPEERDMEDLAEQQIFALVRTLAPDEKLRCLKLLAANFPHRVLAENESGDEPDDDAPGHP